MKDGGNPALRHCWPCARDQRGGQGVERQAARRAGPALPIRRSCCSAASLATRAHGARRSWRSRRRWAV
jgi:hypothetical protein